MEQLSTDPFFSKTLAEYSSIKSVWDNIFADIHGRLIAAVRSELSSPQGDILKNAISNIFPAQEDLWKLFADTPTQLSFQQINDAVERLASIPEIRKLSNIMNLIMEYQSKYRAIVEHLYSSQQSSPKPPQINTLTTAPKKQQPAISAKTMALKIQQLEQKLGLKPTGIWSNGLNTLFLNWLMLNGWDKYIKNNRFTGTIDDALRFMMTEESAPEKDNFTRRMAKRMKSLQIIAGDVIQFPMKVNEPILQPDENLLPDIQPKQPLDDFTKAYIEAALWTSGLDKNYTINDFTGPTLKKMMDDCEDFQLLNKEELDVMSNDKMAGHDFWLTRNGAGAGFWDKELGDVGDRLTDAAHKYKEFSLVADDDGKIYGY